MGMNSLPKTVTRQRRGCDLNPGPTALESSTLTTRLPLKIGESLYCILNPSVGLRCIVLQCFVDVTDTRNCWSSEWCCIDLMLGRRQSRLDSNTLELVVHSSYTITLIIEPVFVFSVHTLLRHLSVSFLIPRRVFLCVSVRQLEVLYQLESHQPTRRSDILNK